MSQCEFWRNLDIGSAWSTSQPFYMYTNTFNSIGSSRRIGNYQFLNKIDQLRVCPGQPDEHFVKLVQKRKGCIKSPDGTLVASLDNHGIVTLNGEKFGHTVWVAQCDLLTNVWFMQEILSYTLRAMYNRQVKVPNGVKRTQIGSKTNFRYLNIPEERQRCSNMRAQMEVN